ncbi:hypothetical protein GCM10023259_092870 [Thermocatellispora tengchongensis]
MLAKGALLPAGLMAPMGIAVTKLFPGLPVFAAGPFIAAGKPFQQGLRDPPRDAIVERVPP